MDWDDSRVLSCAWCGEPLEVEVDPSGGRRQQFVEDCWVCCRPNVVVIEISSEGAAEVRVEQE